MNVRHDKIGIITITVTSLCKKISQNQCILLLYRHTEAESILMILK